MEIQFNTYASNGHPHFVHTSKGECSENQGRVFSYYFYEVLTVSTLATRRIGEQIYSCLQFASCAHKVASEVMETLCFCSNSV